MPHLLTNPIDRSFIDPGTVIVVTLLLTLRHKILLGVYQILELGELIKTKQITSQELTRIFLKRLKR